ncbi:ATP-grasp domain-containing protein [Marinifilum sp. D737]|uniref:ATP-grasp domain-containing protein n=1 Tax=Marinifilum sp. D737 TaxID=2969628 RepID=UPI0022752C22|nr:hypothetical protein [Marinifilum sp. D737]MCY1634888.1 hypothetical protein [Marinifilum sp. D737]
MKIAIHNGTGLNEKSIKYCEANGLNYITVDAYSADIIEYLKNENVTHFLWHFNHNLPEDILMARNVLYSLGSCDIKVYPDFNTGWYFDDKVAEKYILEAIDAPVVKSWPFYHKDTAMKWLRDEAEYPIVAKLRRGAGSYNVVLLKNFRQAKKYCNKMFSSGLSPAPKILADVSTKLKVSRKRGDVLNRLKRLPNFVKYMTHARKQFPKEKGYVYFQEFIAGADCDYRIVVVGDRAWGSMRKVRENDFRASGAGMSYEDPTLIPEFLVKVAFDIQKRLKAQSMSFDFVLDKEGNPHIVEISYCFGFDGGDGSFYWNRELELVHEDFTLEELILEQFLKDHNNN